MFSYVALILVWTSSFIYEYLRDVTRARPSYPGLLATPIFYILSTLLAFWIEHYTTQVSDQKRSGTLWTYWLISVLGSIILTVLSFTTEDSSRDPVPTFQLGMVMTNLFLNIFMFGLYCFAEPADLSAEDGASSNSEKACPEMYASWPNNLFFHWFTELCVLGSKRALNDDDLWKLNEQDKSAVCGKKLVDNWKLEVEKFENEQKALASKSPKVSPVKEEEKQTFIDLKNSDSTGKDAVKKESKKEDNEPQPSLVNSLAKTHWKTFCAGSLFKLVHDLLQFVAPTILAWMIAFTKSETAPNWNGYFYAILLYATTVVVTASLHQYFHRVFKIGMNIRSGLFSMIYEKAFRMSSSSRGGVSVGEIVTYMSTDAQRLMDLTSYMSQLWSSPLQITICLILLFQQIGWACIAGVAIIIFQIPLTKWLNGKLQVQIKENMKKKDKRLKKTNEMINAIKIFKLYAWEGKFKDDINDFRNDEVDCYWKKSILSGFIGLFWSCTPLLVSLVSFTTYVLTDSEEVPHKLDSTKVFVSLTLFNILRFPLVMFPMIIVQFTMAKVSIRRLTKFLCLSEIDFESVKHNPDVAMDTNKNAVKLENASFNWDEKLDEKKDPAKLNNTIDSTESTEKTNFSLKNLNLEIKNGELVAIIGSVGSGKSSLIQALLGDMHKIDGRAQINGKLAYVPQQAWIMNLTLKENITFMQENDDKKYKKIIEACALKSDIEMLPGGDMTEIGEKGINLSGGQKQRVSLARALYSDADTFLFDDPLSAVDAHVGKHIFDQVLSNEKGKLAGKTRVLVTNAMQYVPLCDRIFILKDGEVLGSGTYCELTKNEDTNKVLENFGVTESCEKIETEENKAESESDDSPKSDLRKRLLSEKSSSQSFEKQASQKPSDAKSEGKLMEKEGIEEGSIDLRVFKKYAARIGWRNSLIVFFCQVAYIGFTTFESVWLSFWADYVDRSEVEGSNLTLTFGDNAYYLGFYSLIGACEILFALIRSLMLSWACLSAARSLHELLLKNIIRAPMSFFDTTPLGRILNRFSKDVSTVDENIERSIGMWFICMLRVISTLCVVIYTVPWVVPCLVPLMVFYYFVQRFYIATSRQLKRLESVSRSPIYNHFGESVSGISTIRAFNKIPEFIAINEKNIDKNCRSYFFNVTSNRWLATRLEVVANSLVFFTCVFVTLRRYELNASIVGLTISYAISVTQTLNWWVRQQSEVETHIVSVERMLEYSEVEQEAANETEVGKGLGEEWPSKGEVKFEKYAARYRKGLDLVIKNVDVEISSGEKVGIVGRTGAGKSTITLGLFRLIEPAEGTIKIDGVDITKLGLHDLRSKLTIIPQDPVLWSGTIRYNLDPMDIASDDQIWAALESSHLKTFVQELDNGLDAEVVEGGENFSVGQRALFCLARALLRKSKILIMDEATAAVDPGTDKLIQETIRTKFTGYTVLTIAHRLNTIIDYDKIMVLDKGEVSEFGEPQTLLKNKSGIFYSLCKEAGIV
jgi:ABC-type multidrug transport system fused ATPase/permease subunit